MYMEQLKEKVNLPHEVKNWTSSKYKVTSLYLHYGQEDGEFLQFNVLLVGKSEKILKRGEYILSPSKNCIEIILHENEDELDYVAIRRLLTSSIKRKYYKGAVLDALSNLPLCVKAAKEACRISMWTR